MTEPAPPKATPARPRMGRGTIFAWFVAFCGLCLVSYQLAYWDARGAFRTAEALERLDAVKGFAIMAVLVAIFFLPALIAGARSHNNAVQILLLNIFLGWTFLGWVGALIWSTTNNVRADAPRPVKGVPALCAIVLLALVLVGVFGFGWWLSTLNHAWDGYGAWVGLGAVVAIFLLMLIEEELVKGGMNRAAANNAAGFAFVCLIIFVIFGDKLFEPDALPNALHAISDGLHEALVALAAAAGGHQ